MQPRNTSFAFKQCRIFLKWKLPKLENICGNVERTRTKTDAGAIWELLGGTKKL